MLQEVTFTRGEGGETSDQWRWGGGALHGTDIEMSVHDWLLYMPIIYDCILLCDSISILKVVS